MSIVDAYGGLVQRHTGAWHSIRVVSIAAVVESTGNALVLPVGERVHVEVPVLPVWVRRPSMVVVRRGTPSRAPGEVADAGTTADLESDVGVLRWRGGVLRVDSLPVIHAGAVQWPPQRKAVA